MTTRIDPAEIGELTAEIAKRAEECELNRRVPADLLDVLAAAGALRMGVPARYGGLDLAVPEVLRVIEEISRADGAVGWTVGQIYIAQLIFAHFPAAATDEIYADGPDVLGAGAVAPKGRATREPAGWRVSGQWPFVTGCENAAWIYLQCLEHHRGVPRSAEDGLPPLRMVLLPAEQVEILDTWHVVGLRATGSHDVRVTRMPCADERTCGLDEPIPGGGAAALRITPRDQGGLVVAATACGIAAGAADAVARLAADGKRPAFSTRGLAGSPVFQDQLGEAFMSLCAARALLASEVETVDAAAASGHQPTELERARLRAAGPRAVALATGVVDAAHRLGGGSAVYETSPLQRRLRDAHTVTQHFSAGRDFYASLGGLLAGAEPGAGGF